MVTAYLDTRPDPALYDFLQHDFDALDAALRRRRRRRASAAFPSYPQRYIERLRCSRAGGRDRCRDRGRAAAKTPAQPRSSTPKTTCTCASSCSTPRAAADRKLSAARRLASVVLGLAESPDAAAAPSSGVPGARRAPRRASSARARTRRRRARCRRATRRRRRREEHQIAGRSSPAATSCPDEELLASPPAAAAVPCLAKTYWVKPLQSKPVGIRSAVAVRRAAKFQRGAARGGRRRPVPASQRASRRGRTSAAGGTGAGDRRSWRTGRRGTAAVPRRWMHTPPHQRKGDCPEQRQCLALRPGIRRRLYRSGRSLHGPLNRCNAMLVTASQRLTPRQRSGRILTDRAKGRRSQTKRVWNRRFS